MKMRVSHFDQHAAIIGLSANKPAEDWQSFNAELNINAQLATHTVFHPSTEKWGRCIRDRGVLIHFPKNLK